MRKIIIAALVAATALPGMAMAQNRELSRDRHEIRQEQRELRQARRYGDGRDVRREARDVRQSRREYRADWRDYRTQNQIGRASCRARVRQLRVDLGALGLFKKKKKQNKQY